MTSGLTISGTLRQSHPAPRAIGFALLPAIPILAAIIANRARARVYVAELNFTCDGVWATNCVESFGGRQRGAEEHE